MKFLIRQFKKPFARHVAIMSSGTGLSQLISLLVSPVLTRLYAPEVFGLFGVFMAIFNSILPAISGKYETALMLPKKESVARDLYVIASYFILLISLILLVVISVGQSAIVNWLGAPGLFGWLYMLPIFLVLFGFLTNSVYVANRFSCYQNIAKSRIILSSTTALFNVLLGMMGVGLIGLLVGNVVGASVSLLYLLMKQHDFFRNINTKLRNRKILIARQYSDFPIYNASSSVLDGVTLSLPTIFIAHYFTIDVVGFYVLATRVLSAPISLFSSAVSEVNLKKVINLLGEDGDLISHIVKLTIVLLGIVMIPTLFFFFLSEEVFVFVFGNDWVMAGIICEIIVLALPIKIVASILSGTLGATNHNKLIALWRIIAFISTLVVVTMVADKRSALEFLKALVVTDIILYSFYYILIIVGAKKPKK